MAVIDSNARKLGMKLGLGDIGRPRRIRCWGYQYCCDRCEECRERAENGGRPPKPKKVRQPWETKAA